MSAFAVVMSFAEKNECKLVIILTGEHFSIVKFDQRAKIKQRKVASVVLFCQCTKRDNSHGILCTNQIP